MIGTEVVYCANQIPGLPQDARLASQSTATANQRDPGSELDIQSLDVGGGDEAAALRATKQAFDVSLEALDHTTGHTHHALASIPLDHLSKIDTIAQSQVRASWFAVTNRFSEDTVDGTSIGLISVETEHQQATPSTATDLLNQCHEEIGVSGDAQHAAQPEPSVNSNGRSHPEVAALNLGPDLIGLHLTQVVRSLHQLFVHLLAIFARSLTQTLHCALIHLECGNDSLTRTTVFQQCHYPHDSLLRQPSPVEHRPFAGHERAPADVACVPALSTTVYPDVCSTNLSPCRTNRIAAKCSPWVYWFTLLVDWASNWIVPVDPFLSSCIATTVKGRPNSTRWEVVFAWRNTPQGAV